MVLRSPALAGSVHAKPLGYAAVKSSALLGLTPHLVTVEVSCTRGPPLFHMVGLPEAPVREARVRVASALAGLEVLLDSFALTVNLAPADLPKSGATLDLALALGVLAALGHFPPERLDGVLALGKLSLDGSLQPMRGVLPQLHGTLGQRLGAPPRQHESKPADEAHAAGEARGNGLLAALGDGLSSSPSATLHTAIVPWYNAAEAGLIERGRVLVARTLREVVAYLCDGTPLPEAHPTPFLPSSDPATEGDLSEVRGQIQARRALEVAASGAHNLLFVGPPGAGKTLLARLLRTILPPLSFEEALETTAVHSVAGILSPNKGIVQARPFRSPHHSVSEAGLVGGGAQPRPGEVSLAHNGVLFLDELGEFRRGALEALRQPLEERRVHIARSRARASFPARPLLIAAMNPCPCGFRSGIPPARVCRCSPAQVERYRHKLSGPLLDRIDLHVLLPPVDVRTLSQSGPSESSASVRERVVAARERQLQRFQSGLTSARTNAELPLDELKRITSLGSESRRLLESAATQLGLSARAFVKVLRVSRTIADLENQDKVSAGHVAEAIQGRILDHQRV